MISEISSIKDYQSQVHKSGNRNSPEGMQPDKPGEFSTRDVVEISNLKPVQPVSEDKNKVNSSSDPRNAGKNIPGPQNAEGADETEDIKATAPNATTSMYGQNDPAIGTLLDRVV